MTSRERVITALNHQEPDRLPVDLGASAVTGMHANTVYLLRQSLKLDPPGTPVKVIEPYQLLGEIKPDLAGVLGIDVTGLGSPRTMFGFQNDGWKAWQTFQGMPVLVPNGFNTEPAPNGDILMYPEGDRTAHPSGRMPKGGFYFDAIVRQEPIDESRLDPEDNLAEFGPINQTDLEHFRSEAERLYSETDKAILANFGGTAFGDIALIPATWLKNPKGIRDIAEWYMSAIIRRDYVYKVFERQCAIALSNLEKIYAAVGNRVTVVFVTGTDFGAQDRPFISPATYRDLYLPFHKQVNNWVHSHTTWKTFMHSCGSIHELIPHFIEAGFDILNPVQCSATNMDPAILKREFGKDVVFWGGGVDTQKTLHFGTPDEVRREVRERIRIFGRDGGFIFNTVHNIQSQTPVENILAMYETVREHGRYPLK